MHTVWIMEKITRKEKRLIYAARLLPPGDVDRLIETAKVFLYANWAAMDASATGRAKGGHARAAALTPARRRQIAQQAAKARWASD